MPIPTYHFVSGSADSNISLIFDSCIVEKYESFCPGVEGPKYIYLVVVTPETGIIDTIVSKASVFRKIKQIKYSKT
jgi:hypothetical protein